MNYEIIATKTFRKVDFAHTDIYLLTIYDKSEQETISAHEIENIIKGSNLL